MAFLVIDSAAQPPQPYSPIPPLPGTGWTRPLYAVQGSGAVADSYPEHAVPGGDLESPYAIGAPYSNEASAPIATLGNVLSPTNPIVLPNAGETVQ